jgi:hypothetical protein
MFDPFDSVIRRLVEEWPKIKAPRVTEALRDDYGYAGSVDWSASGWRRCVRRAVSARRSARAIGRGR